MPERVDAARVRRLTGDGARLVEVLPPDEYAEEHLQAAINIPLKALDAEAVAGLRRDVAVIVYCWDSI